MLNGPTWHLDPRPTSLSLLQRFVRPSHLIRHPHQAPALSLATHRPPPRCGGQALLRVFNSFRWHLASHAAIPPHNNYPAAQHAQSLHRPVPCALQQRPAALPPALVSSRPTASQEIIGGHVLFCQDFALWRLRRRQGARGARCHVFQSDAAHARLLHARSRDAI